MNDAIKGEQALRVLDAIEAELKQRLTGIRPVYIGGGRFAVTVTQGGRQTTHRGASLLDALAQVAQSFVSNAEDEAEPMTEADFDRACGVTP